MAELIAKFESIFGAAPEVASQAPGRLEILGNHTDYNEGFVLSGAVTQNTRMLLRRRAGTACRVHDLRDGSCSEFDLNDIATAKPRDWGNYIKGVIVALRARGLDVGAFDAAIFSTVPLSAGMSSSAALEIAACLAFQEAFDIRLTRSEWARIGQSSENNYLGLHTGLLDQFSSLYGEKDSLILSDFRLIKVLKTIPIPAGFSFVVANSMVKHHLVDSEYNLRRRECESAAAKLAKLLPGIKTLRDVTMQELEDHEDALENGEFLRAKHVIGENERVFDAEKALQRNDIDNFGAILFESHDSSRHNFGNSCYALDVLVDFAESNPLCLGARLSGGGFGGISIHLVANANIEEYSAKLRTHFQKALQKDIELIVCSMGSGATAVKL